MAAARAAASSSPCVASGLAYRMFARTVSWKRYVSWVTTPMTLPRDTRLSFRTSTPSISTAPASTSYNLGTRYVVVVLPDPDGPTSATRSPGLASKSMSRSPNGWGSGVATAATSAAMVASPGPASPAAAASAATWAGAAAAASSGGGVGYVSETS